MTRYFESTQVALATVAALMAHLGMFALVLN